MDTMKTSAVLLAAILTATEAVAQGSVESDRAVLVALYNATDGPNWHRNDGWLTDAPLEDWYGVSRYDADDESERVGHLNLHGNDLSGSIPAELGRLTNLASLSLGSNNLSGPIPVELGRLTNLAYLNLQDSNLSGSIPAELGRLTNLEILNLDDNSLSGSIPAELGRLTNLEDLHLDGNNLSGPIPAELGQLTSLETLFLFSNPSLSGPIPAELGQLTNLTTLFLHDNSLSGSIPAELGRLTNLWALHFHGNDLSGSIPAEFGQLTSLETLTLYGNNLSGLIPAELGRLTSLWALNLHSNNLSGPIPAELGQLTSLESLNLHSNNLSGPIPAELGQLTSLENLHLHSNNLSGPIPVELGQLANLRRLFLDSDTGLCLPPGFPADTQFARLARRSQVPDCSGTEPPQSIDREALEAVYHATDGPNWTYNTDWLTDAPLNSWHGVDINPSTGRVDVLLLYDNNLRGSIPVELGRLNHLWNLTLHENNLNGPIPAELGQLTQLTNLRLDGTNLSGPIPPALGQLTKLVTLGLDADTGLCLPPDFPQNSQFATLAGQSGVPNCSSTESPRPVRQTREECMEDAGVTGRGMGGAWDDNVGPCVKMPEAETDSSKDLVEVCRLCWLVATGNDGMRMSAAPDFHDSWIRDFLECIEENWRRFDKYLVVGGALLTIAGATTAGAAVVATLVVAKALGISPSEIVARFVRMVLSEIGAIEGDSLGRFSPSSHGDDWVKVQSTNPDALSFSFDNNGDLEFFYARAEPTEFVWTLMNGDTPVGSLVLPYVPGPEPVVPVLPLVAVLALGAGLLTVGLGALRRRSTGRA